MLGERFVVQDCLGGNDWAAVYRARDADAGGDLRVVRVLRRDAIGDPAMVRRFVAERAGLLTLSHPHVVPVEDIVVDRATVTIVSDHVVGPNLTRLRHEHGGTLPPAEAIELVRQVLLGLSSLHAIGLVHGDVRPASILIERAVDPLHTRVAGAALGWAGRGGQGRLDRAPRPIAFTAPEVLLGDRPTPASDIYCVGVLLYEALAGRTPFARTDELVVGSADLVAGGGIEFAPPRPPGVANELWSILAMLLTKDPADRPSSAVSVADGLGAIAPDLAALAAAPPMPDPDPWSLRPASGPGSAPRRMPESPREAPGGPAIPARVIRPSRAPADRVLAGTAAGSPVPGSSTPPAGEVPRVADVPGKPNPLRRTLAAAAAAVVGLGTLIGVVTVTGGGHGGGDVAAVLPFANESYHSGALVVSRTWAMTPAGNELHGKVTMRRIATGGPDTVPEWLPTQLSDNPISVSSGVHVSSEDGSSMLKLTPPARVGNTVSYSYDVRTRPGPATLARLQGWAVDQSELASGMRKLLDEPVPDTVASLAVTTPAVALSAGGKSFALALSGGDNAGQPTGAAQLNRSTYTSEDPSVAGVSPDGLVRPKHPGATVVTARLGPLATSATVLVTDPHQHASLQFVQLKDRQVVVGASATTPAAPAKVSARAGNGTAFVVWSRPDDGGKKITSYDIYADGKRVASATGNHVLVKGLQSGNRYRFSVVARNGLGASKPSPESAPVVPRPGLPPPRACVPQPPHDPTAQLVGRTTVRVTWTAPPAEPGCPVTGVQVSSYPADRTVTAAPGATTVDIPGLDAVTLYSFAVTASYGSNPAQTSTRSDPVPTAAGACWDGSYSDPCPPQTSGAHPVATPITSPVATVTTAAAPSGTTVPIVIQSTDPVTPTAPGLQSTTAPTTAASTPPATATSPGTPPAAGGSSTPPPQVTTQPSPQDTPTAPPPSTSAPTDTPASSPASTDVPTPGPTSSAPTTPPDSGVSGGGVSDGGVPSPTG